MCCGRAKLLRDHFGECAVEKLSWATQRPLRECAIEELSWATGRTEVRSSKSLTTDRPTGEKNAAFVGLISTLQLYNHLGITLVNVLWRS